jgi:hypothetical protein
MNKSEELWNIVVKEGLNNYNNRKEQPELQTLFLVGTPKSVKGYQLIFLLCVFVYSILKRILTSLRINLGKNNSNPCISR